MPRFEVKVQTNSKQDSVEELSATNLKVKTKAPAFEGRANEQVIKLIAKHFGVSRSSVRIIHGKKSKTKLIEVTF